MPKDKAYQQAEQKIQQALQSGGFPKDLTGFHVTPANPNPVPRKRLG
ncbi:MAG: hypothetical protein IPG44_15960 [Anaerolineales bacterium]|nr:hypothetical protein [Anaerolineales bacterium]